jgi:tetratricopeptide (TPR) repeat protein
MPRQDVSEGNTMRSVTIVLLLTTSLLLPSAPALAQAASSEANGQVTDADGNPLQGAVLSFTPKSNPVSTYTAKTNKKGRYFISGLFSSQGDEWLVKAEYEDWVPVEMFVETRTANRVLLGDPFTKKLKPNTGPWTVVIRPLGEAKIDFKLVPADQVEQPVAPVAGESGAPAAPPKKDPWDEALRLAGDGNLAESIPFFEEAIEEEPADAERLATMAKVLYQMGNYEEAETRAAAAVEMNPTDVDGRMVLYSIRMAQGDLDGARASLEEARAIAPGDVKVLRQLALVANESGNTDDAIAAWEAVTEVDPQDTEAWMTLGDLYAATGDSARSQQAYQRVVELDPSNAHQIFYNLGALIMNRDSRSDADTQQAIAAFRKAVEIKPDYAQAYKQLAFALLGVGDKAGAAEALEKYVEYAPDAPDAAQMRAILGTLSK